MAAMELQLDKQLELVETQVAPGKQNDHYGSNVNPLRKIPALETTDGSVLFDSAVICEYLNDLHGKHQLIPQEISRRYAVQADHALADGIMEAAVLIRYETFLRPEPLRWVVWVDEQWEKINNGLGWFERKISKGEPGEHFTIDQIALACALGYLDFRNADYSWRDRFAGLANWHSAIAERTSYQITAP
jgi:glutathione S-transferase